MGLDFFAETGLKIRINSGVGHDRRLPAGAGVVCFLACLQGLVAVAGGAAACCTEQAGFSKGMGWSILVFLAAGDDDHTQEDRTAKDNQKPFPAHDQICPLGLILHQT